VEDTDRGSMLATWKLDDLDKDACIMSAFGLNCSNDYLHCMYVFLPFFHRRLFENQILNDFDTHLAVYKISADVE